MSRAYLYRILAMAGLAAMSARTQYAAGIRHLTLSEAVHLAINQNRALRVARLKVTENEHRKAGEHSSYFPTMTNESSVRHFTELQIVTVPAGRLG